jgi:S1-C subfamily serine protease
VGPFLPDRVIRARRARATMAIMPTSLLSQLSTDLADAVAAGAPSVVQVSGARRPASGVVHGPETIITTARAIGREDGLRIRLPGEADRVIDADLAGWDPAIGIAVLRAKTPLGLQPPAAADAEPRTGALVLALARSWSNAITASAGIVAVVGGPLRTGRRRQIPRVFRVTAPMHDGFAGGAVFDASGALAGIATATAIRGLGVVIPASIAWAAAAQVLATGTPRRGFIGVAVQPVELPAAQQVEGRARALVIVAVTPSSPADAAGVIVGDVLLDFDGQRTDSPGDLLDLLAGHRVGQTVTARILRGGAIRDLTVTVAERKPS